MGKKLIFIPSPDTMILLVGTGYMGIEYAKVIKHLGHNLIVVGRGKRSAKAFEEATGIKPFTGGIENWLKATAASVTFKTPPQQFPKAIVAVTVTELGKVALSLLKAGFRSILMEKPGGTTSREITQVAKEAESRNAQVYLGYNRRFYASTQKAQELIKKDGGVLSFNFEFTEWSHIVGSQKIPAIILEQWFLANSSHVVDMAFFLGGKPKKISSYTAGKLPWHPAASIFAGSGISEKGALFSYQANWQAPGRWGVEILTNKHRLIFRPLEQLQIQEIGSVAINPVEIDNKFELEFKPGLYKEVQSFLGNNENLCTIAEQQKSLSYYKAICPPR